MVDRVRSVKRTTYERSMTFQASHSTSGRYEYASVDDFMFRWVVHRSSPPFH